MTDDEELDRIRQKIIAELPQMMASMIGPSADYTRAMINAKVDSLIEARKSFRQAGWESWVEVPVLIALAGGTQTTMGKE